MDKQELESTINSEVALFFGVKPRDVKVNTYKSKSDFDKVWHQLGGHDENEKIPDWLVAFATYGDDVHILSPDIMPPGNEKSGYLRYQKTLKHEIAHLYTNDINKKLPSWLREGVSLYVAEQQKNYRLVKSSDLSAKLLNELDSGLVCGKTYQVGISVVLQIIEKYGKIKLFEILKINNNKERYAELEKIFG